MTYISMSPKVICEENCEGAKRWGCPSSQGRENVAIFIFHFYRADLRPPAGGSFEPPNTPPPMVTGLKMLFQAIFITNFSCYHESPPPPPPTQAVNHSHNACSRFLEIPPLRMEMCLGCWPPIMGFWKGNHQNYPPITGFWKGSQQNYPPPPPHHRFLEGKLFRGFETNPIRDPISGLFGKDLQTTLS